jgi:hypothetical protein
MEHFSFDMLWGDARTLLVSSLILTASALIGIVVYGLFYKFISRVTRHSTSTLQLMLAKQTRPPVR